MDLDTLILQFTYAQQQTIWTLRDACQGTAIFGGLGSGKTSGSAKTLALKYLSIGMGGLILTAKISERYLWEEYARLTHRSNDLIIVEPGGKYGFDLLEYLLEESIKASNSTDNIVEILTSVIQASADKSSGKNEDPFWENALYMLIYNTIDLCKLAYNRLRIDDMYRLVQSIPKGDNSLKEFNNYLEQRNSGKQDVEPNFFYETFILANRNKNAAVRTYKGNLGIKELASLETDPNKEDTLSMLVPEYRLFTLLEEFFAKNYIGLSDKTRSIIDFSFSGFLFRLMREPNYSLFFNRKTNFVPEDSLKGKIILIDLPVKKYYNAGRDCQTLFKLIWQKAMEKRDLSKNEKPVFLFSDEAQFFLTPTDTDFLTTARSSRVAVVMISQNLPNYYANMGGQKADHKVKSLLGVMGTKIFHSNSDVDTNRFASELIGDCMYQEKSNSDSIGNENFSSGTTKSYRYDRILRPEEFTQLRSGGTIHDHVVEAIIHIQGLNSTNELGYSRIYFNQNYGSQTFKK